MIIKLVGYDVIKFMEKMNPPSMIKIFFFCSNIIFDDTKSNYILLSVNLQTDCYFVFHFIKY